LGKKSVHRDETRRLSRSIVCILTPKPQTTDTVRREQTTINIAKNRARDLLSSSIEELSVLTDQILPVVTLEMPNYFRESADFPKGLSQGAELTGSVRGCVLQIDVSDSESSTVRSELGISHLVAIQIGPRDGGWKNPNGLSSVVVETTAEKLAFLIHDIVLDIAMFHSWPYLNESYPSTEDRIEFSKRKSAFAVRKSLGSYYGPIKDSSIEYFSFAAHCREPGTFQYMKFRDLWNEFITSELQTQPPPPLGLMDDPVHYILGFHHQAGQISRTKLSRKVGRLKAGTYLFLMTRKRPARRLIRSRLAREFGRKNYRQGLWKIVPFGPDVPHVAILPFVSLFKFRVLNEQ
jgi:hypothetical protein